MPYNLNFTMTNEHIVRLLGEPSTKGGGGLNNIYINYDALGIEINFNTLNWEYS